MISELWDAEVWVYFNVQPRGKSLENSGVKLIS